VFAALNTIQKTVADVLSESLSCTREVTRMKSLRMCRTVSCTLLVLAGCSEPGSQAEYSPQADFETVAAMVSEFDRCARESDLDTFVSYSTEDIVWMPPNEPAVVGKEAVREWYANFYGMFDIEMTHELLESHTFRDVVIARGNATETLTPKAGGSPMSLSAKFLMVLRRQPDGSLKVWRAIANSNTPPSGI